MNLGGKGMLTVLRAAIAPRKPPVGMPSAICILIQSPNDSVCFHTKIPTEHGMAYLMILGLDGLMGQKRYVLNLFFSP